MGAALATAVVSMTAVRCGAYTSRPGEVCRRRVSSPGACCPWHAGQPAIAVPAPAGTKLVGVAPAFEWTVGWPHHRPPPAGSWCIVALAVEDGPDYGRTTCLVHSTEAWQVAIALGAQVLCPSWRLARTVRCYLPVPAVRGGLQRRLMGAMSGIAKMCSYTLDVEVIQRYSDHWHPLILRGLARNPSAPPVVLGRLVRHLATDLVRDSEMEPVLDRVLATALGRRHRELDPADMQLLLDLVFKAWDPGSPGSLALASARRMVQRHDR